MRQEAHCYYSCYYYHYYHHHHHHHHHYHRYHHLHHCQSSYISTASHQPLSFPADRRWQQCQTLGQPCDMVTTSVFFSFF
ncbi:hypothetical protein E2C01_054366 [Portunus trituberculatus]|uniref:Uncharacterized protein n=1 Tax=Portunus trituberculatus TaxID=210409 RepID=A0A5B7GSJ0_PORTR|nr:hypothetical protein [Portunus trituberculatus]